MAHDIEKSKRRLVVDSAVILALITAVLYFLGDAGRSTRFGLLEVPRDLVREFSLQENVRQGGALLLFLLLFIGPLVWLLDRHWPAWYTRLRQYLDDVGPVRATLFYAFSLFALIIMTGIAADQIAKARDPILVDQISFKKDSTVPKLPSQLYYVSSNDQHFVFTDRAAGPSPSVVVISRDEITSIILHTQRAQ